MLWEATNPPVNMAYPLHMTVPERFGAGAVLVFGIADGNCGARIDPQHGVHQVRADVAGEARQGVRMPTPRQDRQ